jgi:hypothetical protein
VGRDLLLRAGLAAALPVLLMATVSWRQWIRAPAVVEYEQQIRVKTVTSGFVEKILIQDDDQVREHLQLLMLSNPDLTSRLRQIELKLEQLRLKSRIAYNSNLLPEMQILRRQADALAVQAKQLRDEVAGLIVRAPASGTVIGPGLDTLAGCRCPAGPGWHAGAHRDAGHRPGFLLRHGQKNFANGLHPAGIPWPGREIWRPDRCA